MARGRSLMLRIQTPTAPRPFLKMFHVEHAHHSSSNSELQDQIAKTPPSLAPDRGNHYNPTVIDEPRLRTLLEPFGLHLSDLQASQTLAYLHLLLRWNEKINLTAIRSADECVTRHFGESFFITRHLHLRGHLLDIGTGAGFPGLALKIVFPDLSVTLLEPVTKKRAFLKEAARVCELSDVLVRGHRLEDFAPSNPQAFDLASMRAVGKFDALVPLAAESLRSEGRLLLWVTCGQGAELSSIKANLTWTDPIPIPLSKTSEVWQGVKR